MRTAAFFLAVVLLFVGFSEEMSVEEKLMEEMYICAVYVNDVNTMQLWAINCILDFCERRTYDSLLIAQAALDYVLDDFKDVIKKPAILSAEEYAHLMLRGIEASNIATLYDDMDVYSEQIITDLESIRGFLLADMRFEPYLEYVSEAVIDIKYRMLSYQRMDMAAINYVLAQLPDREAAEKTWRRIFDDCMLLSNQSMGAFSSDLDSLRTQMIEIGEEVKAHYESAAVKTAADYEYAYFILEESLNGDSSAGHYLLRFDGEEVYFPLDSWMTDEAEYSYYCIDSQSGRYEKWGWSNSHKVPDAMMLTLPDTEIIDILAYGLGTAEMGYSVSTDFEINETDGKKEMDKLFLAVGKDGYNMEILRAEERTDIFVPRGASLVPLVYIDLIQAE